MTKFTNQSSEKIAISFAVFSFLLTSLLVLHLNTWSPYHLDSAIYGLSAKLWLSKKKLICTFPRRCVTCYFYAFLASIAGVSGAHILFVIFSFALMVVSIYLLVYSFSKSHFWALLALAISCSTTAMVVSLSIGKEDPFPLGLFLFSLYLGLREGSFTSFMGGVLWSLSLWSKQTAYLLSPLLILLLVQHSFSKRFWLFVLGSLPVSLLSIRDIMKVLVHKNPNLGIFYGPFSHIQLLGIKLLIKGLGFVGLPILIVAAITSIRRDVISFLLFVDLLLLVVFLTNISVAHYRHALWPGTIAAVLFCYNCSKIRLLKKKKHWISAVVLVLVCYSNYTLYPNLQLKRLNLPRRYALHMVEVVKQPAVVLAMDNCGLVRYYADMKCLTHPAYPFINKENLEQNLRKVEKYLDEGYNVYVYPDFFAYDPKGIYRAAFIRRFNFEKVDGDWFEDYHRVFLYPKVNSFIKEVIAKRFGRNVRVERAGTVKIGSLKFDVLIFELPGGKKAGFLSYKGLLVYGIGKFPIWKVKKRLN